MSFDTATPPMQPLLAQLAKSYQPAPLQTIWDAQWEHMHLGRSGYQGGAARQGVGSFAIQLPPPNVTGTLHMGHAFNQTIMDSLTRYHRMRGYNTAWIPGTDHAGIATQIVVERQLQAQGQRKEQLGETPEAARTAFMDKVWAWKNQSGQQITHQMRRMGATVDWEREYFTMDAPRSKAVIEAFVRLYEQGLIYRGKRLVNWDPVLKSAVSDLEVESVESNGFMHYICYPFSDGPQIIEGQMAKGMTIATTRPETMLADGALAVHPDDERYRHLIGKRVDLPLCDRQIPIIADDFVDREFGSGCVKITGAHDFNDYACAQRHDLPLITIFTLDAHINHQGPLAYQGMDRYACRQAVLRDLEAQQLLLEVKPHRLMLPICARTGQVVEPMLTDQWFFAMNQVAEGDSTGMTIAQKAMQAVASGQVTFVPENWVNTYNQWMNNLQDWCISRQLWWGHQIPAWYDDQGRCYVGRTLEEAQIQAGVGVVLQRDADVLDTWFSSALVPFSTLGWPEVESKEGKESKESKESKEGQEGQEEIQIKDFDLYLPSSVLVTGYDIIFFWVARMIMMTTHFTGRVPFRHVYIHGLVRDAQGRKMSKSEGNVLDPVDLIDGIALPELLEKRVIGLRKPETAPKVQQETQKEFPNGIPAYGADALRLTFASLATLGRAINFDAKRCEGYRNFCNKLWNATRFVLMHCEGQDCGLLDHHVDACQGRYLTFTPADRWIVSLLQQVEADVATAFTQYRLDLVAHHVYDLVWNAFCDWYLEIAKVQLQATPTHPELLAQHRGTRRTLIRVLETILRLAHPIIPYITEDLWQRVAVVAGRRDPHQTTSIALTAYPVSQPERIDSGALSYMRHIKTVIEACRNLRGEINLSPSTKVPLLIWASSTRMGWLEGQSATLCALAKLSGLQYLHDASSWEAACGHAPVVVVTLEDEVVHLCLKIEVDTQAEMQRLNKELGRLQQDIQKAQGKLSHPAFVLKAPAAVLEQERSRLAQWTATAQKLTEQLMRLQG